MPRHLSGPLSLLTLSAMLLQFAPALAAHPPGIPKSQLEAIDRYVLAEMRRQRIPGVEVGIYRHGNTVLAKGYGLANVELNVPMTPTTRMQSGSVGKQFTAAAILMLVEQGKVRLEDPITQYFPDAPESWKAITVQNLLSHTSGLAEYESDERTGPKGPFYLRLDFTEDQLVSGIEQLPIEFKPGDKWDYRNTNYVLLGILIHRVTGQFYGDYLHDRIFAPLGMVSTQIISDRNVVPGRSGGYEIKAGILGNQAFVSPTFNSTADGTLYFNVIDLEKWDRALYGTTLLSRASLDRQWTPFVLTDGRPNEPGYGFGWFISKKNGHRVFWHSGSWQGFTSFILRYVDDGLSVVVLANLDAGHANPGNLAKVIAGLVEPALMPEPSKVLTDTKPELSARARTLLAKIASGEIPAADFAADTVFPHSKDDFADLRASLPGGWESAPMLLIRREDENDVVRSTFRIGPATDTRVVQLSTDSNGLLHDFGIRADPDAR